MAYTLNRRLAQLIDGNGQLNTGKIPNDYITSDHVADNTITSAMLHTSFTVSTSNLTSIDTDDVSEGSTNLYYTDARADARIAAATTDDLTEGSTNLYFTNARVDTEINSYLSGGTGVTYSSGEISIGQDVGTSATPTFGNITTTGYIAGPATFTIDPAAVGDNTGTVVIAGNLQVDGTTTTINSTTMTVDDLNLTLASGAANAAAANGAGITVDGASATITYDGTNDEWGFNKKIRIDDAITGDASQLIITNTAGATLRMGITGSGANEAAHIKTNSGEDLEFHIGQAANATTPRVIFDSSGKVGIGTDLPGEKLHVYGNARIEPSSGENFIISRDTAGPYFGTASNHSLRLITNNGSRVNFDTDGRVLIGVTSGSVLDGYYNPRLQIEEAGSSDSATRGMAITYGRNSGGGGAILNFNRHAGTSTTSKGNILDNYSIGEIVFRGYHTNNFDVGAAIHARVKGTPADGVVPTELIFSTTNGSGSHINALVIDPNQKIGIGTEDPDTLLELRKDTSSTSYGDYPTLSLRNDNAAGYSAIHFQEGSTQRARVEVGNNSGSPYILMNTGTASGQGVYVDGDGRVGIGTTNPVRQLMVQDSSANCFVSVVTGTGNVAGLMLGDTDDETQGRVNYDNSTSSMAFYTADTEKVRIDQNGNVGIGTTPASGVRLDMRSNAAATIGDFRNASATGFGLYVAAGDTSSQYAFRAADYQNNLLFTVQGDGSVGIGTASPNGTGFDGNANVLSVNGYYRGIIELGSNNNVIGDMIGGIEFRNTTVTEGYIRVYRDSSGDSEMRLAAHHFNFTSGNVGIGLDNPLNKFVVAHQSHGVAIDYVGATLPYQAGLFTSSSALTQTAYGDLNIKSRSDYTTYGIGFFTANVANTPTLRMKIDNTGNVGIGTDSPDADLHVEGVTRTKYLRFQNLTDATSEVAGMYSSSGGGTNDLTIYASALSSTSSNIKFLTAPTNSAATTTLFLEGSSGNVGIGDNSPGHKLEVNSPTNYQGVHIRGSNTPCLTIAQGTSNTPSWRMGISGYDGNDFAISTGASTNDRFRIDPDGNMILGSANNFAPIAMHDNVATVSARGPIASGYATGPYSAGPRNTRDWFVYGGATNMGSNLYVHMKTNLWGGGSPAGNTEYTMSCFTYKDYYAYGGSTTTGGYIGWHNWSGSFYNTQKVNSGTLDLVQNSYMSTDGYVVLVARVGASYCQFSIDWCQWAGYTFHERKVTAVTNTASATGAY